jgi:uncharacterized protein YeaO (DUF488 family)
MVTEFRIKRIYDEPSVDDGYRILIDRLWPRGTTKAATQIDLWPKEFTPTTELRKYPGQFVAKYQHELDEQRSAIKQTVASISQTTITLVNSVKNPDQSHAVVLHEFLTKIFTDGIDSNT